MYKILKNEKGVVSIFIVILLPVIIIGGLLIFDYLQVYQQENKAFKITYACSDSILSQYNAYLYDSFALYANHNVTDLSVLVTHYFEKNRLLTSQQPINIDVDYYALDQVTTFNQAIKHASFIQLGNVAENYTMDLLNQLELSDRVRYLNERFKFSELKLAERFELNSYQAALTRVIQGDLSVLELEAIRKDQKRLFEAYLQQLHADFMQLSESDQNTIAPYKLSEWEETNQMFQERQLELEHFENEVRTAEGQILELEALCHQLNESIISIDNALKDTDEKAQLLIDKSQFQNELLQNEAAILDIKTHIAERSSALHQTMTSVKPDIINQMHTLISEITALTTGIDVGEGELSLEEKYKYSKLTNTLQPLPYHEKLLVNEYYLSLFSSYDINSPRALDPLNRMDTERILKGEIEYIITGKASEKESMNWITAQVFALRVPSNLISLLSDTEKMRSISNYTLALPQPWRMVAFTAIVSAWATAESYVDVMALLKGEGLTRVKSPSEWHLDLESLVSKSWQTKKNDHSAYKLYYQDYLRVLLFFQSEETSLKRVMELMTTEIQKTTKGAYDLSSFSRGHHVVLNWRPNSIFDWVHKDSTLAFTNNYEAINQ